MKTHKGTKKRVKVTGSGKFVVKHSGKSHILTKKSNKRKRGMRIDNTIAKANVDFVKRLLRLK